MTMINQSTEGNDMHISELEPLAQKVIDLHHLTPSTTRAHRLAMIRRHAPHASRMTTLRILTRLDALLER
jgi:hypothetical protein